MSSIPHHSVPVLNPNGTMAKAWYEFLEGLRVTGLSDVPSTTPANGNTIRWDTATNKFTFGA